MAQFEYKPLDPTKRQIRLLKLLPIEQDSLERPLTDPVELKTASRSEVHDSPITCKVEVVSLNDNPEYLALSYTWGDPLCTKAIKLGYADCDGSKSFTIT